VNATEAGGLAVANATPNVTSAIALVTGFFFIRRRVIDRHRRSMLTAVGASTLFLVLYSTRIMLTGTHTFAGEGTARTVYLGILFSHVVLAIVVLLLVLRLLYFVRNERFQEHARLARWVFPV